MDTRHSKRNTSTGAPSASGKDNSAKKAKKQAKQAAQQTVTPTKRERGAEPEEDNVVDEASKQPSKKQKSKSHSKKDKGKKASGSPAAAGGAQEGPACGEKKADTGKEPAPPVAMSHPAEEQHFDEDDEVRAPSLPSDAVCTCVGALDSSAGGKKTSRAFVQEDIDAEVLRRAMGGGAASNVMQVRRSP